MQRIPIPSISYSEVDVTLSGKRYTFTFRFKKRLAPAGRWKLDINDSDGILIYRGFTLLEETALNAHLPTINFPDGILIVIRINQDDELCGRDNLGIDKSYELIYTPHAELAG